MLLCRYVLLFGIGLVQALSGGTNSHVNANATSVLQSTTFLTSILHSTSNSSSTTSVSSKSTKIISSTSKPTTTSSKTSSLVLTSSTTTACTPVNTQFIRNPTFMDYDRNARILANWTTSDSDGGDNCQTGVQSLAGYSDDFLMISGPQNYCPCTCNGTLSQTLYCLTPGSTYTLSASIGYLASPHTTTLASPPTVFAYLDSNLLFASSVCDPNSNSTSCVGDAVVHYHDFKATVVAKGQDPVIKLVMVWNAQEMGLPIAVTFREVTMTLVAGTQYVDGN